MLKHTHSILVVLLLLLGCTPSSPPPNQAMGNLDITLKFTQDTYFRAYTLSTTRPITTWSTSIKDLMLILYNSSGIIQYTLPVPLSSANNNSPETRNFTNIPIGTYTVLIIANTDQAGISTTGYPNGWDASNIVGKNINTLNLSLVSNPNFSRNSWEGSYSAYQAPAELFRASQSNITISADQTTTVATPFTLTRIISLLRVRIDQSAGGNNVVNFMHPNADLRIRNIVTSYNLSTGVNTTPVSTNLIYSMNYFNSEPTTGYTTGKILDTPNKITLWRDVIMFPGGSTGSASKKFNLIISGVAPVGYKPKDTGVALTVPTLLYWTATASVVASANNIREVNCSLTSKGSTKF